MVDRLSFTGTASAQLLVSVWHARELFKVSYLLFKQQILRKAKKAI